MFEILTWNQDSESRPIFEAVVSELEDVTFAEFHDEPFLAYQETIQEFEGESIRTSHDSGKFHLDVSKFEEHIMPDLSFDISKFFADFKDSEKVQLIGHGSLGMFFLSDVREQES